MAPPLLLLLLLLLPYVQAQGQRDYPTVRRYGQGVDGGREMISLPDGKCKWQPAVTINLNKF